MGESEVLYTEVLAEKPGEVTGLKDPRPILAQVQLHFSKGKSGDPNCYQG